MTKSRKVVEGARLSLTRHTVRGYQLLAPDEELNKLYTYCLEHCAATYGMELHSVTVLPNFERIVLTDPNGLHPEFTRDLHRMVSVATKQLRSWDGPVWDHQKTKVVRLHTEQALLENIAECLLEPVAAGFVDRPEDWPGICVSAATTERALSADKASIYPSKRNKKWSERLTLRLRLPRLRQQKTHTEYRAALEQELHSQLPEVARRPGTLRQEMRKRVPVSRLNPRSRRRRHASHTNNVGEFGVGRHGTELLVGLKRVMRCFQVAYRAALEQWRRRRRNVRFPYGTYALRVWHSAHVGDVP